MAKFKDKHKPEVKATECKYKRGEHWKDRHRRRERTANKSEADLREWCDKNGISLKITNGRKHWHIREAGAPYPIIQWWPATAKMVIRYHYDQALHVHDITQLMHEAAKALDGTCLTRLRKWNGRWAPRMKGK